jgi:hypothetical protein
MTAVGVPQSEEPPGATETTWELAATPTPPSTPVLTGTLAPSHSSSSPHPTGALAQEASLVAEARAALVRGDPRLALQAIQAARTLPSRQLVPEELTIEAQALRALGREDDANQADAVLRARYPESALAR